MGRKKKASTQPEEEQQKLGEEQIRTAQDPNSSEDSTGGETIDKNQSGEENGSSCTQTDNSNNTSKESNTPEDKEELSDRAKQLKETYDQLGGKDGVQKRAELTAALLKYKSTDEALSRFREVVGKDGFIGLSKEKDLIPIVEAYGSIKDKTALAIIAHWDMKKEQRQTPLITRKRVDDIRDDVRSQGIDAMKEFMVYLAMYDSMRNIYNLFYRLKNAYYSFAYQSIIYFQTYEWLGKAEELFNSFAPLVDASKQDEFSKLTQNYNTYLQSYQRFGELEEVKGEGWIDKQRENCLTYADVLTTDFCTFRLAEYKGAVVGIEKWIAENKAEMLIPMELREQLQNAKTDFIQELQSKYYTSHLKYMEENGETPTDADRKIALFPEYEETKPAEGVIKYIYKQLDGYKQKIQQ